MSFLNVRKTRNVLGAITTTTTTRNKPSQIVFGLIAAVVVSVGFIACLAILAPQQLAEAAVTAADLVCNGCVGTSDIANNAVTSAKIGTGQVGSTDLANDAVITGKIKDGEVKSADIEDGTITSTDIAPGTIPSDSGGGTPDDNSVTSTKIADGEVKSDDIGNGEVKTEDLASGAIKPNVHKVQGPVITIPPGSTEFTEAICQSGEILTGGGFSAGSKDITIINSFPRPEQVASPNWYVSAHNGGTSDAQLIAIALCMGPSP